MHQPVSIPFLWPVTFVARYVAPLSSLSEKGVKEGARLRAVYASKHPQSGILEVLAGFISFVVAGRGYGRYIL